MRDISLPAIGDKSEGMVLYEVEWRMKCGRLVYQPVYATGIVEAYSIAYRARLNDQCCGIMTCQSIIRNDEPEGT